MRRYRHAHPMPPWWPEGEPWPPFPSASGEVWRHRRGRFLWRVSGLAAAAGLVVLVACIALSQLATEGRHWPGAERGPAGFWPAIIILVAVFMLVGRALRQVAMPVGDLMQAAGHVADGDYTVHVDERGPKEVRALAIAFNGMVAQLRTNDRQRRDLLADVTHELRTPLTVIQGNLEGLIDGIYPRDDAHLASILEETRILARVVDDLRTLALAESGTLHLNLEPADLSSVICETATSFRAKAQRAGVTLETDTPGEVTVEIDPERIRQVLENLLSNALRYTPPGGTIRLGCRLAGNGRQAPAIVTVTDTGTGIPPDKLAHIFERFAKSSDSGGSGLGLAIARNLVVAHGGEITASSQVGVGTTMRITLPQTPAA